MTLNTFAKMALKSLSPVRLAPGPKDHGKLTWVMETLIKRYFSDEINGDNLKVLK
jgi:hypothetical protein